MLSNHAFEFWHRNRWLSYAFSCASFWLLASFSSLPIRMNIFYQEPTTMYFIRWPWEQTTGLLMVLQWLDFAMNGSSWLKIQSSCCFTWHELKLKTGVRSPCHCTKIWSRPQNVWRKQNKWRKLPATSTWINCRTQYVILNFLLVLVQSRGVASWVRELKIHLLTIVTE